MRYKWRRKNHKKYSKQYYINECKPNTFCFTHSNTLFLHRFFRLHLYLILLYFLVAVTEPMQGNGETEVTRVYIGSSQETTRQHDIQKRDEGKAGIEKMHQRK